MKISDIINKDSVEIGAELSTKDEVLDRLIALHKAQGNIRNTEVFRRELNAREAQGNSAVSGRIAIPAVCHSDAQSSGITALTLKDGVDYGAQDRRRVKVIFMISGRSGTDDYLRLKTRLMRLLMDSSFTAALCAAKTREEFIDLLNEREAVRFFRPQPGTQYDCSKFLIENNKKKHPVKDRLRKFTKESILSKLKQHRK